MPKSKAFPLVMASEGELVQIVAVRAGKGLTKRLTTLGFNVHTELRVVQRRPGGSMVIARGDVRMALGVGMAQQILVVPAAAK